MVNTYPQHPPLNFGRGGISDLILFINILILPIMEYTGTFKPNSTQTVDSLKSQQGFQASDAVLEIINNPQNGKKFFQLGKIRGAVTNKLTPAALVELYRTTPRLVCVSILVTSDGTEIPVLHKRGDTNVLAAF